MSGTDKKTPAAPVPAAASADEKTAVKQPTTAMEAIEEDDEFEEFQVAHWGKGEEDAQDTQQWMDNWDADDMDDDFTKNLREELMKHGGGGGGGGGTK